jgi:protein-S-isoprenylcysteine O-methyltransferase Ste14
MTEISISILAFLLIAGWMLSLPEGTLEPSMRGFRKNWPDGGKVHFFGALAAVYFVPVVFFELMNWVYQDQTVWLISIYLGLTLVATVLGLSLLTVAYRRNLKQS